MKWLLWKCLLFCAFVSLAKLTNEHETIQQVSQENTNQEVPSIQTKDKPTDCQALGFQETLLCSTCKDLKQFAPSEGLSLLLELKWTLSLTSSISQRFVS